MKAITLIVLSVIAIGAVSMSVYAQQSERYTVTPEQARTMLYWRGLGDMPDRYMVTPDMAREELNRRGF